MSGQWLEGRTQKEAARSDPRGPFHKAVTAAWSAAEAPGYAEKLSCQRL